MILSNVQLKTAYLQMLRIRRFEEQVYQLFLDGKLYGTTHLYNGQEAVAVGVCSALDDNDRITSTHRGHGHAIAKGGKLAPMMAEMLGRETGYCKGKGGSMHIGHIRHGNLGANGIVGGSHGIAVGSALAQKMRGEPGITVCFFGDGSMNEGSLHEAMNLASTWNLPVLFVCENNLYGMSTETASVSGQPDLSARGVAYGIPGREVDGNHFIKVFQATQSIKEYVRTQGPGLLVCHTYRQMGHSRSDEGTSYRSEGERAWWKQQDPLTIMEEYMDKVNFSPEDIQQYHRQVEKEVQQALIYAENSPFPPAKSVMEDVYA